MSDRWEKIGGTLMGIAALVFTVGSIFFTGVAARALGFWSYPAFFGFYMAQSGMILFFPWKRFPRLTVRINQGLTWLAEKLARGRWAKVREKHGPFWVVIGVATLIGPVAAALSVSVLRLEEKRGWRYVFIGNLIATLVVMSFYLGAFEAVYAWFQVLKTWLLH